MKNLFLFAFAIALTSTTFAQGHTNSQGDFERQYVSSQTEEFLEIAENLNLLDDADLTSVIVEQVKLDARAWNSMSNSQKTNLVKKVVHSLKAN